MYEQSQMNIQKCFEKSIKLDEIPKRCKKKSTKITNVHGSMEGQDILKKVEVLEKEKEKKKNDVEARKIAKEELRERFFKCKSKCICEGVCEAKECPNCHSVMKSTCSKIKCQVK